MTRSSREYTHTRAHKDKANFFVIVASMTASFLMLFAIAKIYSHIVWNERMNREERVNCFRFVWTMKWATQRTVTRYFYAFMKQDKQFINQLWNDSDCVAMCVCVCARCRDSLDWLKKTEEKTNHFFESSLNRECRDNNLEDKINFDSSTIKTSQCSLQCRSSALTDFFADKTKNKIKTTKLNISLRARVQQHHVEW